jgi:hypothetical protein
MVIVVNFRSSKITSTGYIMTSAVLQRRWIASPARCAQLGQRLKVDQIRAI